MITKIFELSTGIVEVMRDRRTITLMFHRDQKGGSVRIHTVVLGVKDAAAICYELQAFISGEMGGTPKHDDDNDEAMLAQGFDQYGKV